MVSSPPYTCLLLNFSVCFEAGRHEQITSSHVLFCSGFPQKSKLRYLLLTSLFIIPFYFLYPSWCVLRAAEGEASLPAAGIAVSGIHSLPGYNHPSNLSLIDIITMPFSTARHWKFMEAHRRGFTQRYKFYLPFLLLLGLFRLIFLPKYGKNLFLKTLLKINLQESLLREAPRRVACLKDPARHPTLQGPARVSAHATTGRVAAWRWTCFVSPGFARLAVMISYYFHRQLVTTDCKQCLSTLC